ncbi:MAG: AAA family ATPase [Candidatus Nanoarchaeia archaeon]|nr:AAA family ATPase [Candidatus Nanoarchaeia archaeon]
MAKTGCKVDEMVDYSNAISCIYGKPATGKTTLCLMAAANEKGKVVFIETENSFSADRMQQIAGKIGDNLVLMQAKSFEEQCRAVESLLELKGKISLVIVDSLTAHYRKELQEKNDVNPMFSRQLSMLKELASSNIPVLVTSQVYATKEGDISPVGSNMLKNWCNNVIKLHDDGRDRKMLIEKSAKGSNEGIYFEITNEGIKTR